MQASSSPPHPHVALLVETSLASGRDILRGIARYVRECGPWALYHAPHGLDQAVPGWFRHWKGDGIIARITTPAFARLLKNTGLPVVDVLGMVPRTGFPIAHVDDDAISRLAFEHLSERGFRHFAFIGLAGENWSESRRDAFLVHARKLNTEPALREFTRRELEETAWEKRQAHLASWLRALPKPVGLMVCSDQHGLDVLEACRRGKIAVPDEVAVVGVDNDEPLCEVCTPPLTSVWPDHLGVGYHAAELLDGLMQGAAAPVCAKRIAPRCVVTRQSSDVLAVDDPAVATALRLIRERACSGASIDEITRAVGTSRSVLQRRFRAVLGETIHDHMITVRIKRALELIATTALPLPDIAERCGFNHQEYMGAVFRARLGHTPAAYRKSPRALSAERARMVLDLPQEKAARPRQA